MDIHKRIYSKEVLKSISNKNYVIGGWIHSIRNLGNLIFLILRDKYGFTQITLKKGEVNKKLFNEINKLNREDVILVQGKLKSNKKAPGGKEIIPSKIEILNKSETPLPIEFEKVDTALSKRIDWRFIDMRNPKNLAVFELESELIKYISEFLRKKGFVRIFSSKIVSKPTEGGANFFPVLYFDKEAFLAQSPQFYKESVLASGIDRVFEIAPVFRAEPHHTVRHLCEYISIDYEMAFIESMEDVMKLEENLMVYVIKQINKNCKRILNIYNVKLPVPKIPFPRIRTEDAYKILGKKGKKTKYGEEIDSEGEIILGEYFKKKNNTDFYFITEFPWKEKPFYVMRKGKTWSCSFDLEFKGVEITTGGQREHRYKELIKNAKAKGVEPNQYDHLKFFKYGMPPHGGLGTGLERFTKQLLNLENIREATLLPRDPDRINP